MLQAIRQCGLATDPPAGQLLPLSRHQRHVTDNSSVDSVLAEYEFSEILVCRYEEGFAVVSLSQNLIVCHAWRQLSHICNLVALLPETIHDLAIDILIREISSSRS